MYLIRNVFIAKPGSAGKLAKLMKEVAQAMNDPSAKVYLDFVTDFNKIVMEHQVPSLGDYEKNMDEFKKKTSPELAEKMKNYTELYQTGYREIYKIVD